jgi:anti-sigma-K factor RskA
VIVRSLSHPPPSGELRITGGPGALAATGHVRWTHRTVEVAVSGLPALPPGKVYQLWHLGPMPKPVPQGTFTVDPSGELHGWDTMAFAIGKNDRFAISREPAGGSLSPTSPLYAVPGN